MGEDPYWSCKLTRVVVPSLQAKLYVARSDQARHKKVATQRAAELKEQEDRWKERERQAEAQLNAVLSDKVELHSQVEKLKLQNSFLEKQLARRISVIDEIKKENEALMKAKQIAEIQTQVRQQHVKERQALLRFFARLKQCAATGVMSSTTAFDSMHTEAVPARRALQDLVSEVKQLTERNEEALERERAVTFEKHKAEDLLHKQARPAAAIPMGSPCCSCELTPAAQAGMAYSCSLLWIAWAVPTAAVS